MEAGLDKVLFVIAGNPPHKPESDITPAGVRAEMVAAAIAGQPVFEVSRVELESPRPSYTADTLRRLDREYPGAELYFLLGYDSALDLPRWRNPEEILRRAILLIAPRPESAGPLPPLPPDRFRLLAMPAAAVSSSDIRERVRRGDPFREFVPAAVAAIIESKGLYHANHTHGADQRIPGLSEKPSS